MKIREAESWLNMQLQSLYSTGEASSITALVMEHITGQERSGLMIAKDEPLNVHQLHHLTEIVQRLTTNEPVQYVLGEAWFHGLKLFVDRSVLVPRPETEELVEWIIKDVKAKGYNVFETKTNSADKTSELKILDVGTGSGCIALALKKAMPLAEVWGCDVSDEALNIARRNGSQTDVRVDFQQIDFLDASQHRLLPSVDIIVSNPPYIPLNDKNEMHPNVVDHEPHLALFVPDNDALVFYKAIAAFSKPRLHKGGIIYMEIHENLGNAVRELMLENGFDSVEIKQDMQGKDRMVKVQKNSTV